MKSTNVDPSRTMIPQYMNDCLYVKMELLSTSAKPYWEEEPKDVETSVGASTTFICKAKGYPEPKIAWFVNGIKLEGTEFCSRIC